VVVAQAAGAAGGSVIRGDASNCGGCWDALTALDRNKPTRWAIHATPSSPVALAMKPCGSNGAAGL
jgi:hypothetical protein